MEPEAVMPLLSELSNLIESYRDQTLSLDDFAESFERISRVMFSGDEDLVRACLRIEDLLSRYRDRELDEPRLKAELANAVQSFPVGDAVLVAVLGEPQLEGKIVTSYKIIGSAVTTLMTVEYLGQNLLQSALAQPSGSASRVYLIRSEDTDRPLETSSATTESSPVLLEGDVVPA